MSDDLMAAFRSLQASLLAHRDHLERPAGHRLDPGVPVTLLTGSLGAGKSTLLAALLADPPTGSVVKAVVNDVGRLPFDPTLIGAEDELEIELSNGCGCCEDAGDVASTLRRLAEGRPDLIVLEASGVADPFALAQVVEADQVLGLDRIVAVINGATVEAVLANPVLGAILRRQLEAAHVVVVSHADLVSSSQRLAVGELLAVAAPGRTIAWSNRTEPTTQVLLPASTRGAALPVDSVPPGHHLVTSTAAQHQELVITEIERALDSLPSSVVRCKGVLATESGVVSLQATTVTTEVTPVTADATSFDPATLGVTVVGLDQTAVDQAIVSLGCASPVAAEPYQIRL